MTVLYRGLCIINEFLKRVDGKNARLYQTFLNYRFTATSLINAIISEHECKTLFII